MPDNWPDPRPLSPLTELPEDLAKDLIKALYEQQLAWQLERLKWGNETNTRTDAHFLKVSESHYDAYLETGKGLLTASTERVEQVIAAASAIATLYTGILAFAYSTGSTPAPTGYCLSGASGRSCFSGYPSPSPSSISHSSPIRSPTPKASHRSVSPGPTLGPRSRIH